MNISHVAIWAQDIELLRDFYCRHFGASAGPRYYNPAKEYSSYFLTFPGGGASLEIMNVPGLVACGTSGISRGFCHMAISVGPPRLVDEFTGRLCAAGVTVVSPPRTTGDGFYESVIADPEGNLIELTA